MTTSAQVVETSVNVTNNSPSRGYSHPDDQTTQTNNSILFSCLQELGPGVIALVSYAGCGRRARQGFGRIAFLFFIVATNSTVRFHWLLVSCFFLYCAISLAPVHLEITCNSDVTSNSPRANRLLRHLSNSTFPSSQLLVQARAFLPQVSLLVQTDCDYRYALKV